MRVGERGGRESGCGGRVSGREWLSEWGREWSVRMGESGE